MDEFLYSIRIVLSVQFYYDYLQTIETDLCLV